MSELHRMTSRYVPHEDRIRLTGEDEDGNMVTLWFTQRLLNRLIGSLCLWLERQQTTSKVASNVSAQQHLVQSFAQQRAAQALSPTPPVAARGGGPASLVDSVDLLRHPKGVRLVLMNRERTEIATLIFGNTLARQWLSILLSQYQVAQWPTFAWPWWMLESMPQQVSQESRLH